MKQTAENSSFSVNKHAKIVKIVGALSINNHAIKSHKHQKLMCIALFKIDGALAYIKYSRFLATSLPYVMYLQIAGGQESREVN